MTAAGVSPPDAQSNLAGWWELTGYEAPRWLSAQGMDHKVFVCGMFLLLAWFVILWLTRSKQEPGMSGDTYHVSNSGSGIAVGSNHGTITQNPAPEMKTVRDGDWVGADGNFQKFIELRVLNHGNCAKVSFEAIGTEQGLRGIGFNGEGMLINGNMGLNGSTAWGESLSPALLRGVVVYSDKPMAFELKWRFE